MDKAPDPFDIVSRLRTRNAEAIIGQSRTKSLALREFLRKSLTSRLPSEGALVRDPIIEAAHPFEAAELTMEQLAGGLLTKELVEALDGGSAADVSKRQYRFARHWHPHRHQILSWEKLCQKEAQSVLVTSGTGSGKTECFLIPLLNDLARQAAGSSGELVGIQAIALYPLNALIASQKERLSEWTAPFNGKIRFGLYNGLMPDDIQSWQQALHSEQVLSRKTLRSHPPPILVTNVTMLEYMLARAKDQPMIEKSKGKLKWIILDEAHTHVGAAAAEITLLIRRVLEAFEVDPKEVRFVATSATIGTGDNVMRDLKRYLCDVSGAPEDQVHVIEGHRRTPVLPAAREPARETDLQKMLEGDQTDETLFDILAPIPEVQRLIQRFAASEAVDLHVLEKTAAGLGLSLDVFAGALSRAQKGDDVLAPLRVHIFHRAVPGLWSCVNAACPDKPKDWRFGKILHHQADHCPSCAAPVLQIVGCNQCGEAMLEGDEIDGHLVQPGNLVPYDEFADDTDRTGTGVEADDDQDDSNRSQEDAQSYKIRYLFPEASQLDDATPLFIEVDSGKIITDPKLATARKICLMGHYRNGPTISKQTTCPSCFGEDNKAQGEILRPFRFGAPSLVLNSSPSLLDGVEVATIAELPEKAPPGHGKRLLSFSDSRQGTARLSAKLEMEAERSFMRAFIYQTVQNASALDAEKKAAAESEVKALEGLGSSDPTILKLIQERRDALTMPPRVTYADLQASLSNQSEVSDWIMKIWHPRDPTLFADSSKMADFLLIRELYQRPRRANSVETLGLAQIVYPKLDFIQSAPKQILAFGATLQDWRDFLNIALNFWVRTNVAISVDSSLIHWTSPQQFPTFLIPPGEFPAYKAQKRWPRFNKGMSGTLPALLAVGLGLNGEDPIHAEIVDGLLKDAWDALRTLFSQPTGDCQLDIRAIALSPLEKAWKCSETGRILDRCFRGISPYAARDIFTGRTNSRCSLPIKLPTHPSPFPRTQAANEVVENWLKTDPTVLQVRQKAAWSDKQERAAREPLYYRSAEHSAQQPADRLRGFEDEFKRGELNILNCSTTMEMGVDIGSVSTVMMTNVPPSIASYRQRVGRAGRRGQAMATSFTLCKDRPLDREVFADPLRFLRRTLAAPRVALDSQTIVQRHVNAWLLSAFVRGQSGETFGAKTGPFFGFNRDGEKNLEPDEAPARMFTKELRLEPFRRENACAIARIVKGSILEGDETIFEAAAVALEKLDIAFAERVQRLSEQSKGGDAQTRSIQIILKRLCDDFLLGHLADGGFLPGHGFPTDVVQFVVPSEERKQRVERKQAGLEKENRRERFSGFPSRSLDVAIREYAPGADVVLDGLVHRSGGVTLNWKRPASDEDVREIQSLPWVWECKACGAADTSDLLPENACPSCGADHLVRSPALKPSGFMSDWREKAHSEVEEVTYVSSEPISVSLHGAMWSSFADPSFGRVRESRSTKVIHKSAGLHKSGYSICLECGRATAEEGTIGESPLSGHLPLRGERDGVCAGNTKPFAIRRNHLLIHSFTTDGVELQLRNLNNLPAARALASAVRESLARDLGIEADEMGLEVGERTGALNEKMLSLFLFDRASGGAGFAVQAPVRLSGLWQEISEILDCELKCDAGCSNCVVNRDVGDRDSPVDRKLALAWVLEFLKSTAEPSSIDQIGQNASLSNDVLTEIEALLIAKSGPEAAKVQIVIEPRLLAPEDERALADRLTNWAQRGTKAELVLSIHPRTIGDPSMNWRLWGLAQRARCEIRVLKPDQNPTTHYPLASITYRAGTIKTWYSREKSIIEVDGNFGKPRNLPIVRVDANNELPADALSLRDLQLVPNGARMIHIDRQLNGTLVNFGNQLTKIVIAEFKALAAWPDETVKSIGYNDRYCSSPLTIRLFLELCKSLIKVTKSEVDQVAILLQTLNPAHRNSGRWGTLHNDFADIQALAHVATIAFDLDGLVLTVEAPEHVPHARTLEIEFSGGRRVFAILDQGFGAWATSTNVLFPANRSLMEQARTLKSAHALINIPKNGRTHIVIGQS